MFNTYSAVVLAIVFVRPFHCGVDDYNFDGEENPEFAENIPNITVPVGREARLPCIINNLGSYRAAWLRVEEKDILTIHHHVITRNYRINLINNQNDNRNFILHIKNVQESDRGGYMCQINTVPMKSQIGYLDVVVPPDILVDQSSSDVIVNEGSNVTLKCRARGYPQPEITWRREDGERIPLAEYNGKRYTANKTEGENLHITRVTRIHSGAWLCIASNGVMPSVSRRILLQVQFSPQIWIPTKHIGAPLGKNVSLDCHIEAFPEPMHFWFNDSHPIVTTSDKFEIKVVDRGYKTNLKLFIFQLEEHDLGNYHCYAKNALGEMRASVKLYAIEMNELSIKESLTNRRNGFDRNGRKNLHLVTDSKYGKQFDRQSNQSMAGSKGSPFSSINFNLFYSILIIIISNHLFIYSILFQIKVT